MKFKATLFALLAASALPSHGQTTTYTWYGFGPDNNWTSNTNWSPTRPASSNTTILEFAGATRTTANNNLGDWALDLNSLNFASGASSFTLTGNSFGFRELRQIPVSNGNGGFAKGFWPQEINQNSANPQTISISAFAFRSDSDSFINLHEGDLTINSTVYIDSDPYNHRTLTVGGKDLTRRTLNLNGTLTKGSSSGEVPQLLIRQGKRVVVNGSLALGVGGDATVTGGGRLEVGPVALWAIVMFCSTKTARCGCRTPGKTSPTRL